MEGNQPMTYDPTKPLNVPPLATNIVMVNKHDLAEAIKILDSEFGHAEAIHNPAALKALALLKGLAKWD